MSKLKRLKVYPFNIAAKIKVISFSSKLRKAPILNDSLILSETIECITLHPVQIDTLTEILYNYNYSKDLKSYYTGTYGCYEPRHAILFTDKSDKIISYIEMCIECKTTKSPLPKESLGVFCDNKYDLFEAFYRSIGIKYFKEEK